MEKLYGILYGKQFGLLFYDMLYFGNHFTKLEEANESSWLFSNHFDTQ